jgi:PAS domain S-box-containing protein
MSELPQKIEILLVDDRREDLTALSSVLAGHGYELVTATSGADGLRRALEHDFAVIVLDVMMPGIDGFEVARLLRRRPRSAHTPIIFLTGAGTDTGALYRAYSVGAVDYLMKPVDSDVFRAKVAIFADLFRMDQRIRHQAEALLKTERRMRELEVAQLKLANERRYRNLADAIPQIVWITAPDGAVTYFNHRWSAYTGMGDTATRSWLDAVHPDERGEVARRWADALVDGGTFDVECRLRGADGTYRWHLCRALPERGAAGEIVAWLGTHTDFDELQRARVETEAARARAELLAKASVVLAATLDVGEATARLGRLVVDRIADACVVEVDGDDDTDPTCAIAARDPARRAALEEAWRAGTLGDELGGMRPQLARGRDGAPLGSAMIVPIVVGEAVLGRIVCFAGAQPRYELDDLGMAEDLGRRAGAAIENARQYARAERAVRARDEFLSVASHELRTPLSALMLQLGGLERAVERAGDDRLGKKTTAALRHTNRLAKLVERLLDVSRLATRRLTLDVEDCDVGELVQEVADRFGDEARQAGCAITTRVRRGIHRTCDRLRVEQVLTNLIANALRYGAGQPIEVGIDVDAHDLVLVTVRDHGIGIAAEDLPRIFDCFERAAPKLHYGGLGLGLYIAREIAQAHGGWIRADSRLGEGATFTFALPGLGAAVG